MLGSACGLDRRLGVVLRGRLYRVVVLMRTMDPPVSIDLPAHMRQVPFRRRPLSVMDIPKAMRDKSFAAGMRSMHGGLRSVVMVRLVRF